ncbi:PREDICTED: helix-loop-helix protein 11 [Ceratosolen solmsi marchali]|uniref:Helix-loop-helix protein 11 n=1 Tax=Ceratosolen solmsi marchali TaxID=326594 RepID=A0AAJ7DYL2_9HYME|nr:PREDICTED: helix-loop-helix protein 11 [Ceratosolen solmsi marchali]
MVRAPDKPQDPCRGEEEAVREQPRYALVVCPGGRREYEIMSVFGKGDHLLEEIVETTEEQEADLCSSGETVDECSGLPISDFVEEPEHKHQPVASSSTRQHKSSRSSFSGGGSGITHQGITLNGASGVNRGTSRSHMEQEKRMRREIANSNERRRMQSINAGFQSLRTLLPHHEGEKLSKVCTLNVQKHYFTSQPYLVAIWNLNIPNKAAILQQTAEYIYQLEQQKTQLLSQNLQLKRLVDQHEGGDVPTKKRKGENQGVVVSLPVHVSESGDEGLGSMSPEPLSVITVSADGHASVASSEVAELKRQLERERVTRAHLEKQMRSMQSQLFPERFREEQLIAYQPHEMIEHTGNILPEDLEDGIPGLQVVSVVSVPSVGSTQTVETSNADTNTPPLSPQPGCEIIVSNGTTVGPDDSKDAEELLLESQPDSPKIVGFAGVQVFTSNLDEQTSPSSFGPGGVTYTTNLPVGNTTTEFKGSPVNQFIAVSPTRSFSPDQDISQQQRLPSVLEAAMKAEPKVEVERLPSPSNSLDDGTPQARLYLANTSRQNLETIVEAIRHLEGDHLFSDEPAQDVPLALTNKQSNAESSSSKQRLLHAEVNNFLQFHSVQQQQQQQQHQQQPRE